MGVFESILDSVPIPEVYWVQQLFQRHRLENIRKTFAEKFASVTAASKIRRGCTVAVAVVSRGIANQPLIVLCLVEELRRRGAEPFIVPAMGSHGGATAEGQKARYQPSGNTAQVSGLLHRIRDHTGCGRRPLYEKAGVTTFGWSQERIIYGCKI